MNKRSKSLSLILMSSLTLGVAGCASDETVAEEFKAYRSIDECVRDAQFTQQECSDMALAAVKQSPKFADMAACEKEFGAGNCQSSDVLDPQQVKGTDGATRQGSSWMPLMAGYMMGRYMGQSGPMYGAQPLYSQNQPTAGAAAAGQPAAGATRTSGGFASSFRTAGGTTVQTDAAGRVSNPSSAVRQGFSQTAKPLAVRSSGGTSRGGFSGGTSGS